MKRETYSYHMSNCINNKVEVYPKYFLTGHTINGKYFEPNSWYVCVNNDGKEQYYNKKIGSGKTLSLKTKPNKRKVAESLDWAKAIRDTYIFWSKKIDAL